MRKISAVLLVFCLMLSLCACDFLKDVTDMALNETEKPKTFDLDGVTIELTTNFIRMDELDDGYDFIVGDPEISILGTKVPFDEYDIGECSVMDYAQSYYDILEVAEKTEISEIDGIPTMNCVFEGDDGDSSTAIMFYKGEDAFWVIMFSSDSEIFDGLYEEICGYAKTVKCE